MAALDQRAKSFEALDSVWILFDVSSTDRRLVIDDQHDPVDSQLARATILQLRVRQLTPRRGRSVQTTHNPNVDIAVVEGSKARIERWSVLSWEVLHAMEVISARLKGEPNNLAVLGEITIRGANEHVHRLPVRESLLPSLSVD